MLRWEILIFVHLQIQEVQIPALSFQPFMLEPSVPGMEVEHLGGFRRGRGMMRRGLHYFAASIAELKSRVEDYLLFKSLFFCRHVNLKHSLC